MKPKSKLILSSTDYARFTKDTANRTTRGNPRLTFSMKAYGWLDAYPANVIVRDGVFVVKDGQHRCMIAEEEGIPIKYVIGDQDQIPTPDLNCGKQWALADYVSSYIQQGKMDYSELANFKASTGLSLGACIIMLGGHINAGGESVTGQVRAGKFKIRTAENASRVWAVLRSARETVSWWNHYGFVSAVNIVLLGTNTDYKVLCQKIRSHPAKLKPQTCRNDFILMIEDIYNFHSRVVLPISATIKQAQRNQTEKGK